MRTSNTTKLGFTTVVELRNGSSVIIFDEKLSGLRLQFEQLVPDVMFDVSKAEQVEIRRIATCGMAASSHASS